MRILWFIGNGLNQILCRLLRMLTILKERTYPGMGEA